MLYSDWNQLTFSSNKANGLLNIENEELEFCCLGPLGGICRFYEHGVEGALYWDFDIVIFIGGVSDILSPDQVIPTGLDPLIVCPQT